MFSTPLTGMQKAAMLLDSTAARLASPAAESASAAPGDSISLSQEMTSLLAALSQFEINSKALQAEVNMTELAVNIAA